MKTSMLSTVSLKWTPLKSITMASVAVAFLSTAAFMFTLPDTIAKIQLLQSLTDDKVLQCQSAARSLQNDQKFALYTYVMERRERQAAIGVDLMSCCCQEGPSGPPGKDGDVGRDGAPGQDGTRAEPGRDDMDMLYLVNENYLQFVPQCPCMGPPGEQGEVGMPGNQGKPGGMGMNGRDGSPGNSGTPGTPGLTGVRGLPGLKGPVGDLGEFIQQNVLGKIGDPGKMGNRGPPGRRGEPGKDGKTQKPGVRGLKGRPGFIGDSGMFGRNGLLGEPGDYGPPGSCDHCPPARLQPGY